MAEKNQFQLTKVFAFMFCHTVGMLPRSQVSPKLVEKFRTEERAKRRMFLQKFVDKCSAVQVYIISRLHSTFYAFQFFDFMTKFFTIQFH